MEMFSVGICVNFSQFTISTIFQSARSFEHSPRNSLSRYRTRDLSHSWLYMSAAVGAGVKSKYWT